MAKPLKSSVKETRPVKPRHEREEFGEGEKGLVLCSECKAAYYKKSWHHGTTRFEGKEDMPVKFTLCPADRMIKNKQYEGKVVIKNIPKEFAEEIANLIKNTAASAYEKDPMHRLISIKKQGKDLAAFTTENELAASMAKRIRDAYGKAKVKISYSAEPSDISSAIVEF